jgi:hypothetical protein
MSAAPFVGLCTACRHVRVVESKRGSRFYLCGLAAVDPAFPKYPGLPVLRCRGFTPDESPSVPVEADAGDAGASGPALRETADGDAGKRDASSGDATAGDATAGDATARDAPSGDASSGDASSGDATARDAGIDEARGGA